MGVRRGLYETLISDRFEQDLRALDENLVERRPLNLAEASDRLALYLAQLIERSVDDLAEEERVQKGIELVRTLVEATARELNMPGLSGEAPVLNESVLRAILALQPDGSPEPIGAPAIPLLDTTLLTNSPGEPRLLHQLHTEIETAHRIDVVMAFIRRSGIRPLLEPLRQHCEQGGQLRVLTTTYTGSTECGALEELRDLGAEIRVSYDTSSTRLHAKAWLFFRDQGISTSYVGSSNLTYAAQVSGLEWNVRASGARNPHVVEKISAVFDAYWESGDFEPFVAEEFRRRTHQERTTSLTLLSPVEIRLEPFQERLLEEIEVARDRGHHRNLLVSATGTGKTVMAAVDYARLRSEVPRATLLFVAHRTEILEQSISTYRHALRDGSFGELWVGGNRPKQWKHVFASIQSLSRSDLENLAPDHFDVVVVDEFHHAAAKSYRDLLDRVRPRELLGLTATPERADDLLVLDYFDGRIAAELRLWDAIDQHRLVPFTYYGLHDNVDLTHVPWKRGRGYDVEGLANVYTANDAWARLVLDQTTRRVDDLHAMRTLGFCVSVEHARFMARVFSRLGVPSAAVWGDSTEEARRTALEQLRRGEINVLFSVDLFNEGVDLPNVDTLLLLRPTDSPTLFLQQLGRGLRKCEGKHSCLVLDFVGQHRREFRFDRRFSALLGGSRKHVENQVKDGFPFLPAGCHMELDRKTREIVLESIRRAIPSHWPARVSELRKLRGEGRADSLAEFLNESGLDLEDVYDGRRSWSELQEAAGAHLLAAGPEEESLRRACGRLLHVDDLERLDAYRVLLRARQRPAAPVPVTRDGRLIRMLLSSLLSEAIHKEASLEDGLTLLWKHPQVRAELVELFDLLAERLDHHHFRLERHEEVPLQVHARYTKAEIIAAFAPENRATTPPWQTGVRWVPAEKADLLAFTLDKTTGQFSPTTRYRDYAISQTLIHWESQSATRADSETGLRYRNHVRQGSSVMLFARLRQSDRSFWFLGPATYVRHERERPMAVTWRLDHRLPGDLFASFAAAVA
jgi:superfamily II DNA or RNA helicase